MYATWVFRQEWTEDGTDQSVIVGCSYHHSLPDVDEFIKENIISLPGYPYNKPYPCRVFGILSKKISRSKNGHFNKRCFIRTRETRV
jgi:hypothetical protein